MAKSKTKAPDAINRVIISNDDGDGVLNLSKIMYKPEDLSGHSFYLDYHQGESERILEIGEGSILTIPRELMEQIGYHRQDGRYALPIYISFRHVDGNKVVGGGLIKGSSIFYNYLDTARDGKSIPKEVILKDYKKMEVLHPADIPEWTQSGDD